MKLRHVLIEVYCENNTSQPPLCCKDGIGNPGYHCLSENCPNVSYTYAPHELAYAGEFGVVPDSKAWIGFGGDMFPVDKDENKEAELKELWERICRQKIQEAYEEYMKQMKEI
ncbi:hypothetical protein JI735_02110 [Paenibacillus sonchi]|uniref:Uncharacterized protein n=2 Tax=Paenibacillus sonchi group TaxID=2044880 RepID=A0A974PDN2_9BACL|nr:MULTISPECIES: hypothetical protein [Paenibacillus sonchi group]KWX81028.1 hypothetical protein AMQ84_01325 [Paenibacillus riograndensis]QQZ61581.1 hypothetical protein JI735_02110 [Paenibacillus sonchi]